MNETYDNDEQLLIDLLLGRCEPGEEPSVRRRLETDEAFRKLHQNLANTFAALRQAPEYEAPEDLVDQTLAHIRRHHATEALLAREKPAARILTPTFSLRELGALAAAAVLLAMVFIPSIYQARSRAQIGQCASNIGQIASAIQAYASANNGCLPRVWGAPQRWLPADGQPAVSNSSALFKLIAERHTSPTSFQCPAVGGSSFVVQAGMTDFPSAGYISYSYQHSVGAGRLKLSDNEDLREGMAILADRTPLFVDGVFRRDRVAARASDNHGGRGQNVLYLGMHVDWRGDAAAGYQGDNIFLAGNIRDYRGDEAPADARDTFLLPAFSPPQLALP